MRVFLDEGAPLAALLRELMVGRRLEQLGAAAVPVSSSPGCADAFERARHADRGRPPGLALARCPGSSATEHPRAQVLQLIAAGHPNRIIAERLVITVDTVKRHVSHVFNKLSVANRTEAVARARQLELLP